MILFRSAIDDRGDAYWDEVSTKGSNTPAEVVRHLIAVGASDEYRLIFVKDDGRLCDERFDIKRQDQYVYCPLGERAGIDTASSSPSSVDDIGRGDDTSQSNAGSAG